MSRHYSVPLVVTSGGALGSLAQGSEVEIANAVAMVLATPVGDRRSVPDFGLPDPLGLGVDPVLAADVITEWEPRADPAEVLIDPADGTPTQRVTVYPSPSSGATTTEEV